MRQLFISDLHLGEHDPHLMKFFHAFMKHFVRPSDCLYILGDFFEVWIGDDDSNDIAQQVMQLLTSHTGRKYLMHGNRDFLLGEQFAKQVGAQLIYEPYPIELADKQCVLLHGDSLCTDDVEYQQFKQMVRSPQWQAEFLAKPLSERQAIAQGMRQQSQQNATMKSNAIMDVSTQAVIDLFQESEADIIIHGHTHRQNRHPVHLNGATKERIVLGDWGNTASVLVVDSEAMAIHNLTLQQLEDYPQS